MQKFHNTLWEFTGGKENKDNFIQIAFKVCNVYKVKSPKSDVPSKKTTYNLFWKNIWKIERELQGVPLSKASAIISKEWTKVKAGNKKMKKYRDLYKDKKRRHEEVLKRYQEDRIDEMETINLHKRCKKKARKILQPQKAPRSSKSDEPKKESGSPGFKDEEQRTKKASGLRDGKKTSRPKKVPKSPNKWA